MLICLAVEQNNLDSLLATQFEKANYFIFFNHERREFDLIQNQKGFWRKNIAHHLVAEKNPDLLICGNIEPWSYDFLKASGVKIASGVFSVSAREAIDRYLYGRLRESEKVLGAGCGRML